MRVASTLAWPPVGIEAVTTIVSGLVPGAALTNVGAFNAATAGVPAEHTRYVLAGASANSAAKHKYSSPAVSSMIVCGVDP